MVQFVLKVRDLEEGLSDHRFRIPDDWLADQLRDIDGLGGSGESGAIELAATRKGREVLLRGTIRTTLRVICVRCLEEFPLSVVAQLDVLMLPGQPNVPTRPGHEDDGEGDDELGVERYKGDEIVLDDLIRDTILLEVPMNPNCGEACGGWGHLEEEGGGRRRV